MRMHTTNVYEQNFVQLGTMGYHIIFFIFLIQSHHMSILDFVVSLLIVAEV
jgi:hypothetical protein